MMSKLIKFWPILILLGFTFMLRVVKLEELFYFTYDESIPAFVGRRLILWQHIPLIGAVTPFNFHLAPYFYWFLTFILWLGKLNPLAWGYAGAAIAVLTTLMTWLVGKTFFNKKTGFLAATLWTFSYLANIYDRHLWALYWGPLISLIVLYSLYRLIKGEYKFIYALSFTLALSIHADLSNLVFLIFSIFIIVIYKLSTIRSIIIIFATTIFFLLPLVIFDLRHNFANTKPVLDFIKQGKNAPGFDDEKFMNNLLIFPRAFSRLTYTFGDNEIAKQYSYCRNFVTEKYQVIPTIFVLTTSLLLISFALLGAKRRRDSPGFYLISILILFYFLSIQIYGTIFRADIFEHYITGLFAVFLLIFAKAISLLPKKILLAIMAIFVFANLYKLSIAKNSHGLKYKRQAVEYTMQQIGNKSFSLDSLSTCWKYSGYRYLFAVFGNEPVKSYVDPNFGHLYGTTQIATNHPETVVTFVIHDSTLDTPDFYKRYTLLKSHETINANLGNIEVIVMNNSLDWFKKE